MDRADQGTGNERAQLGLAAAFLVNQQNDPNVVQGLAQGGHSGGRGANVQPAAVLGQERVRGLVKLGSTSVSLVSQQSPRNARTGNVLVGVSGVHGVSVLSPVEPVDNGPECGAVMLVLANASLVSPQNFPNAQRPNARANGVFGVSGHGAPHPAGLELEPE